MISHHINVLLYHHESNAVIPAFPEAVFAFIDDHKRLSTHMSQSSWQMGGGVMTTTLDAQRGQQVGSHIQMSGRVLGIGLSLDEVIVERKPPTSKVWETVGSPKLLVIGPYRMGFEVTPHSNGSVLRVFIDYVLPSVWPDRWLGRMFGGYYAQWCTRSMVKDAVAQFTMTEKSSPAKAT